MGAQVSALTNPWWLNLDSSFLEANMGYQAVIAVFFLACLPLNIAINSYAMGACFVMVLKVSTSVTISIPYISHAATTMEVLRKTKSVLKRKQVTAANDGLKHDSSAPQGMSRSDDGPSSSSAAPPSGRRAGSATWQGRARSGVTTWQSRPLISSAASSSASLSQQQSWPQRITTMLGFGGSQPASPPPTPPPPLPPPGPGMLQQLKDAFGETWSVIPSVNNMLRRVW